MIQRAVLHGTVKIEERQDDNPIAVKGTVEDREPQATDIPVVNTIEVILRRRSEVRAEM